MNRLELGLKIEGVIFDNDGTLVDSGSLSAEVIVGIVTDHGALVSFEEALDRYRGTKLADFAGALLRDFPVMDRDAFIRAFRERTLVVFTTVLKPVPGALERVSQLPLAKSVASNGPMERIEERRWATSGVFCSRIAAS
ncbi:hypothetical protein PMI06_002925 [Burkholderia sp. BT03]|nr:hypothetical protein PMI06_002925 [Burkholderia sp. BT03]